MSTYVDVEDACGIVSFLGAIQPLRGCDYSNDTRFKHGDQLIREFAAAKLVGKAGARLSIKDAADVLHLMHNIEPNEGETVFDGRKNHVGYSLILEWIEHSLRGKAAR